ncbi:MAG: hypothetical protein AAFP84_10650 [Actinomycetota bacterium]
MRHRLTLAVLGAAMVVAGCRTPTENFQVQTEEYLNDSSLVSDEFGGADVAEAACERPDETIVGTTYRCTAEVDGVGTVTFRIQITDEDEFSVVAVEE